MGPELCHNWLQSKTFFFFKLSFVINDVEYIIVDQTTFFNIVNDISGLILGLCPANEGPRYFAMMSLNGWMQT